MNINRDLKELKAWLIENGYDGLFCAGECACSVDDLAPCGETDFSECEPGYKVPCPESCGCHDWHISHERRPDERTMTGLYLHPLRLKALSEGRLSVLRVPMTNLGNVKLVERADPADWNAGRAHPNMRRFEEWKDKDAGALFFVDTGSVVFVPAPYAPGDYFVKEKLFAECYASKSWNDLTYEDGEEVLAEIPVDWCPPINAVRTHWESGDNIPQGGFEWYTATVASMFMPEWAARYVLTLGPPVPGRLGDVDVSSMQQEGIFASLMQDPCDMAKQIKGKYRDEWNTIYPGHPWHPGLWTWAYPVRRKR